MGAWIETFLTVVLIGKLQSHPTWVRGLKQILTLILWIVHAVAPYVGAWIETVWKYAKNIVNGVAPYVGAWIET